MKVLDGREPRKMKRALLISFSALTLSACADISLEGDAARPWACIPSQADGGVDAGKQCSDGWSCGFDQKCFLRDGGQAASTWRCITNDQCPSDWRCGALVNEERFCQRLDAGAPSPCNVLDDCQGGWRCGFEQSCFDPSLRDGGSQRQCVDDDQQCPLDFRCGEEVGGTSRCLLLDAGTPAPCNTDRGCEGGFRCDTRTHTCVLLTDAVTPGSLTNLRGVLLSPLSNAPAPSHFAATGPARVNAFNQPGEPGVVFVTLDGTTVRAIAQSFNGSVANHIFRLSRPNAVRRLGIITEGPFASYDDGIREQFTFGVDGGQLVGMNESSTFTYERVQPMAPYAEQRLGIVKGMTVELDSAIFSFGGPVIAATVVGDSLYGWTANGALEVHPLDGGMPDTHPPPSMVPAITPGTPVSVVAGVAGTGLMPPQTRPGFFLVTPRGYQPWLPFMSGWVASNALLAPCDPMLQVSYGEDGPTPAAVIRCGRDGGVFSIKQNFEGSMMGGLVARSSNVVDDLVPYRSTITNQVAAATVRAHAGANGRLWQALPGSSSPTLGERPLRALVLDRQPDVVLWVRVGTTSALFASVGSQVFSNVARNTVPLDLGFVSEPTPSNVQPLQTFANRGRWLVVSAGIIDVAGGVTPTAVAQLPAGTLPLTAPVSASVTTLGSREVVLLTSRDSIWAADVTGILGDPFAQPATLEPVLVPQPGVRLRSLTLVPQANGVGGFVTTNTQSLRFETSDLVRWSLSPVEAPDAGALPLEVWAQGSQGRVGTANGIIWSLPIMIELTKPLSDATGGPLVAGDFARLCGEQFVTTPLGVHRLVGNDAGLPQWVPVASVNSALDALDGLKLYETTSESTDGGLPGRQLYVATPSGQVIEVLGDGPCP